MQKMAKSMTAISKEPMSDGEGNSKKNAPMVYFHIPLPKAHFTSGLTALPGADGTRTDTPRPDHLTLKRSSTTVRRRGNGSAMSPSAGGRLGKFDGAASGWPGRFTGDVPDGPEKSSTARRARA